VRAPPATGGHPCGWGLGQQRLGELAFLTDQQRVKLAGLEALPDRLPQRRHLQPLEHQVGEQTVAEVVVAAVGEDDQPPVPVPVQQRGAHGQGGDARHDPHRGTVDLERVRAVPMRPGAHPDHPGAIVLPARLGDKRPQLRLGRLLQQHGMRGGAGHGSACQVTRAAGSG
jgi:hypothetical protein